MDVFSIKRIIDSINYSDLTKSQKAAEIMQLKEALTHFKCPQNLDVQSFLNYHAVNNDLCHRTRTFLCFEQQQLIAYYSIAIKALEISGRVSKSFKKKLCYGLTDSNKIPAYLIAQIGKDNRYAPKNIIDKLIRAALSSIDLAQKEVGGRVIYLEYEKDNKKLRDLYIENGFTYLQSNEKYDQMVLITN